MKSFVPVLVAVLLFVLGPIIAIRPSRRQAQLARLRASAVANGLRVRIDPDGMRSGHADYVLPWQPGCEAAERWPGFMYRRDDGGAWHGMSQDGGSDHLLERLLRDLPEGVVQLRGTAEGLVARWDERGSEADVLRMAEGLRRFAEHA